MEGVEEVKFVESYPVSARIIQHNRKMGTFTVRGYTSQMISQHF
jgi:hypothetical protein